MPESLPAFRFEQNTGAYDPAACFVLRARGYHLFLTASGTSMALRTQSEGSLTPFGNAVRLGFVGARPDVAIVGEARQAARIHHLHRDGAAPLHAPTFGRVRYRGLWQGIDAVFYEREGQLEYDFELAAGVDPAAVRLRFDGLDDRMLRHDGALVLRAGRTELVQSAPIAFQPGPGGTRSTVPIRFELHDDGTVGFGVDRNALDPALPLTIDPVLVYASYLGGSTFDVLTDVTTDGTHVYVCGYTDSIDLPSTAGALQTSKAAGYVDAVVAKLTADGSQLVWCTYLGGSTTVNGAPAQFWDRDEAQAIALGPGGEVVIAGSTGCTDFPLTAGAHDVTLDGANDAFVCKLGNDGSTLLASTLLGGTRTEEALSLAVDAAGHVFVAGETRGDFPLVNPLSSTTSGGFLVFASKLSPDLGTLLWSTYLRTAAGGQHGGDIAIDSAGRIYVAGRTNDGSFPIVNGFQTTMQGANDAFLVRIDPTGSQIEYSTLFGGSGAEGGFSPEVALAVDDTGRAWLTGYTNSTDLPVSPGALQSTKSGGRDMFVACFDTGATGPASRLWSTYLGGGGDQYCLDIAADGSGKAHVLGYTAGDIAVLDPWLATPRSTDMTLSIFDPTGTLLSSTYVGGESVEPYGTNLGGRLCLEPSGDIYIAGSTGSRELGTPGSFAPGWPGSPGTPSGFVAKLTGIPSPAKIRMRYPCSGTASFRSLVPITGPVLGRNLQIGVGDPGGNANLGASRPTFLAIAAAPEASAYPCGVVAPGYGIRNAASELMIDLNQPLQYWLQFTDGARGFAIHSIPIPSTPSLLGATWYAQGVILHDLLQDVILTDAVDLTFGN